MWGLNYCQMNIHNNTSCFKPRKSTCKYSTCVLKFLITLCNKAISQMLRRIKIVNLICKTCNIYIILAALVISVLSNLTFFQVHLILDIVVVPIPISCIKHIPGGKLHKIPFYTRLFLSKWGCVISNTCRLAYGKFYWWF